MKEGGLKMERDKGIDWDKEIASKEEEYRKGLWSALARRSQELNRELVLEEGIDPMCDEILDRIECEMARIDPEGYQAMIDHEGYWRFTGSYPVFVWGEDNLPDEGK